MCRQVRWLCSYFNFAERLADCLLYVFLPNCCCSVRFFRVMHKVYRSDYCQIYICKNIVFNNCFTDYSVLFSCSILNLPHDQKKGAFAPSLQMLICSSTSLTFASRVRFISSITEVITEELEVLNSFPAASLSRITELSESAPI